MFLDCEAWKQGKDLQMLQQPVIKLHFVSLEATELLIDDSSWDSKEVANLLPTFDVAQLHQKTSRLCSRSRTSDTSVQWLGPNLAFRLRHWLAGRRKTNVYAMQTKDIADIGIETVRYKVLPLGNNAQRMGSTCFLICCLSHPSDPVVFYL
jgi:hypothetical protein